MDFNVYALCRRHEDLAICAMEAVYVIQIVSFIESIDKILNGADNKRGTVKGSLIEILDVYELFRLVNLKKMKEGIP